MNTIIENQWRLQNSLALSSNRHGLGDWGSRVQISALRPKQSLKNKAYLHPAVAGFAARLQTRLQILFSLRFRRAA